ncbi:MAG: hypothetical protein AAF928_10885 [Myxococcota bacterium]
MCLVRSGRVLFAAASAAFVAIGILHIFVHLRELSTESLASDLIAVGPVPLGESTVSMWRLWQGVSLLMGAFSVALGCVDLAALRLTAPDRPPPTSVAMLNVAMLTVIAGVGVMYLGPIQAIGAPIGMACFVAAVLVGRSASSRRLPHR